MGTYSKLVQSPPTVIPAQPSEQKKSSRTRALAGNGRSLATNADKEATPSVSVSPKKQVVPAVLASRTTVTKATLPTTFRYPQELLEQLNDTLYDLRKRHKVKITKTDVVVGALNHLLADYAKRRSRSTLYRLFIGDTK